MARALALLLWLVASSAALAQPARDAKQEATRLFDEGRALAEQGDIASACERFTRSFALDPAPGTELNLGDCHEHLGDLAEAWRMFADARARFLSIDDAGRASFAKERADALLPRLGTLILELQPAAEMTLRVAGHRLDVAPRVEVRVDPGAVAVEASAPGHRPIHQTWDVAAGATRTVTLVLDRVEATPVAAQAAPARVAPRRRSRIYAAYAVGGVAGLSLATSAVLAITARSAYRSAIADCASTPDGRPICNDADAEDAWAAGTRADIATGFGAAGIVLVGAAAVLYLTAPRDVIVAPTSSSEGMGLAVTGRF